VNYDIYEIDEASSVLRW